MKKAVSKDFRAFVLGKYPALAKSTLYRIFFRYLAFGTLFSRDKAGESASNEKRLVLPYKMLRRMLLAEKEGSNFDLSLFLRSFQAAVLPAFEYSEYEWGDGKGKAREVISYGFDEEMQKAIEEERKRNPPLNYTGWQDFITGNGYHEHLHKIVKPSEEEELLSVLSDKGLNETQKKISDYLHTVSLPSIAKATTERINKWDQDIRKQIEELPKKGQREANLRTYLSMRENTKIIYHRSERGATPRLSAGSDTLLGLKKDIRKFISRGLYECDLHSSQFAILATILNAPISKALLDRGESVWQSFYFLTSGKNEMPPKEIKGIFKELIYSICFGKGKEDNKYMKSKGARSLLEEHGMEKLLEHEIVRELFELREPWFQKIKADKGARDCWGNWHELTKDRWHGSIGATIIQSIEMDIISAIFDCAKEYGEPSKGNFVIYYFQHDGATIAMRDSSKIERTSRALQEAVKEKAAKHNVNTRLDIELLQ